MCAFWKRKEGYDPDLLAMRIEESRIERESGKISFHSVVFGTALAVLLSSIGFDESVPESERYGLLHRAVFSAAEKGKLTAGSILGEISRLEHEFASRPPRNTF